MAARTGSVKTAPATTGAETKAVEPRGRVRLSAGQQIERLVVTVALIGLALTGLAQHYAAEPWGRVLLVLGGGVESIRILHRFFAVLFIVEAVYHVLAVAYRAFVLGRSWVMLPRLRDFADLVRQVAINLGIRRGQATSNYRFALKIEYIVLVIGAIILILTGLALWNPIAVTSALPGETIPIARSLHADHALFTIVALVMLRLGIVLLWHPSRAALFAESEAAAKPAPQGRRNTFLVVAAVLAVIVAGGLYLFLSGEQTAITTVPRQEAIIFAPDAMPESGDAHIGEVLWNTTRCAFCHGADGLGGAKQEPAVRGRADLTFEAFVEQVRIGRGDMPSFTHEELPDGYLVHLWAWVQEPAS
ncbi:MAG: c-type cytochrome [Chloroflexi bacterium]|nr:c-type cytochrome [Chloroflexota bacterium]